MSDALSLSRTDLPDEIEKAIEALCDAEHAQVIEGSHSASAWCEAATVCQKAREALTAAILSRLGEAEATEKELATLRRVHRWNVEHRDGEVLVCRNNHDKGDDCDWERFVPEERLTAALARVERLESALEPLWQRARAPGADRVPDDGYVTVFMKDCREALAALSEALPQGEQ